MARERIRTRTSTFSGQRIRNADGSVDHGSYTSRNETTSDIIETRTDCNLFTTTYTIREGGVIRGLTPSKLSGWVWQDYPCGYMSQLPDFGSIPTQNDNAYATSLVARTNPARRTVATNVVIAELREIPGLVRDSYKLRMGEMYRHISKYERRLKIAAKLNIVAQFGILPLISDVHKMLIFQKYVDQRIKELNKLRDGKGLRRTVSLVRESTIKTEPNVAVHSSGCSVKANVTTITTLDVTGHVRYRPQHSMQLSDRAIADQAYKAVMGRNLTVSDLYNVIPWSWFVDYFTNLGSYLETLDNTLPVRISECVIVRKLRSELAGTIVSQTAGVTCSPIRMIRHSGARRPAIPGIQANVSALTPKQLSILGSLSVLKAK